MDDLHFETKLTEEEIAENFKNFDLFESLMASLEEAVDYAQGRKRDTTIVRRVELTTVRDNKTE